MSRLALLLLVASALAIPSVASADLFITIVVDDTGKPVTSGPGTTLAVAEAAAAYWEAAFVGSSHDYSITITVGWGAVTDPGLAVGGASLIPPSTPGPTGTITMEFDGTVSWWFDGTPYDDSEFTGFTETSADLGGGVMNIGRVYTGATASGPAIGEVDALSVLLHEMGHALQFGLDFPDATFPADPWDLALGADGDLDIDTVGIPFFGATLPISSDGGHFAVGTLPDALLEATLTGRRMLASEADIVAIAEIHGFTTVTLDPKPTPEPSSLALCAVGLALLAYRRRRTDATPAG